MGREEFFSRLTEAGKGVSVKSIVVPEPPPRGKLRKKLEDSEFRLDRFKEVMISQKTEILDYPGDFDEQVAFWINLLAKEKIARLAYSSKAEFHSSLSTALGKSSEKFTVFHPDLKNQEKGFLWDKSAKQSFLNFEAGITEVEAGLADTGSLILIPSPEEPRVLSLVPPIHIALLPREEIVADFWEWLKNHPLPSPGLSSPSNLVLISGPSKTADIEKRLVYGVHGPKRLIVVLIS